MKDKFIPDNFLEDSMALTKNASEKELLIYPVPESSLMFTLDSMILLFNSLLVELEDMVLSLTFFYQTQPLFLMNPNTAVS